MHGHDPRHQRPRHRHCGDVPRTFLRNDRKLAKSDDACPRPALFPAGGGGNVMKKMLIAAAATLALAVSITPSLVSQSAAAPLRSPYCDMAKSQRNPLAWNRQYGCLDADQVAAARAEAHAPARTAHAKKPYCDMAKSQRNPLSWNA